MSPMDEKERGGGVWFNREVLLSPSHLFLFDPPLFCPAFVAPVVTTGPFFLSLMVFVYSPG